MRERSIADLRETWEARPGKNQPREVEQVEQSMAWLVFGDSRLISVSKLPFRGEN